MHSHQELVSLFLFNAKNKVFVSEMAKSIDKKQLDVFLECIDEVHSKITLSSALSGLENNAKSVMQARYLHGCSMANHLRTLQTFKEIMILKLFNRAIETQAAGNCYEFSFLAQSILLRSNITSEIFRIHDPVQNDNHLFLVIHRDPTTTPENYRSWNEESVIFDPFLKQIYFKQEIPLYLKSCFYDEKSNKVEYLSFHPERHRFDNRAKKELIEDYQQLMMRIKASVDKENQVGRNVDEGSPRKKGKML